MNSSFSNHPNSTSADGIKTGLKNVSSTLSSRQITGNLSMINWTACQLESSRVKRYLSLIVVVVVTGRQLLIFSILELFWTDVLLCVLVPLHSVLRLFKVAAFLSAFLSSIDHHKVSDRLFNEAIFRLSALGIDHCPYNQIH